MRRYENGEELLSEIRNRWNRNVRAVRLWGFVASILMIIMGVLCFIYPVLTTYAVEVMASVALLLFGVLEVVRYFQRPAFLRTGAGLALGVLNIVLALLLLSSPAESMLLAFGFLFGLSLLTLGLEQATASGRFRAIGIAGTGWLTAEGALNIIAGIILLLMPYVSAVAFGVVLTVYMLVGGISLLITSVNAKDLEA